MPNEQNLKDVAVGLSHWQSHLLRYNERACLIFACMQWAVSSIYVMYGQAYKISSIYIIRQLWQVMCMQAKIKRARSFYLTIWLWPNVVFNVRLETLGKLVFPVFPIKWCHKGTENFSVKELHFWAPSWRHLMGNLEKPVFHGVRMHWAITQE